MSNIFITRRIFPEAIEKLEKAGHRVEINDTNRVLSTGELMEKLRDKQALICLLNDDIDSEVMDAGPDLQVIANVAVGYDNIDVEAATEREIMVTNTPGVLTETTADMTFALLLSAARRIPEADRYSREGKYESWELMQPHLGVDVHGKTLGIVGMGRIGQAVAKRGIEGFEMECVYYDRGRKEAAEQRLGASRVSLEELLQQSDFLSVHPPLTSETRHLLGSEEFEMMKKEAILVNAARGPIVDEEALAQALKAGEILGAALDVFENEPSIHPELLDVREHVVLSPHLGSASRSTRREMADLAVSGALMTLNGEIPEHLVNEELAR
ncbi:MAG: 2-hydroxyacid dehydrogenase [Candidatus Acetothermia bacterium]